MKTIELSEPFDPQIIPAGKVVLATGFFDGVHCGHQQVIKTAARQAKKMSCKLAVMTLDRHPMIVFQHVPTKQIHYLTTLKHKLKLFQQLGADYVYVIKLAGTLPQMPPQEFVDKYMVGLHAAAVVAGEDYTYGKHTIANMQTLPEFARNRFQVITVKHVLFGQKKISSTMIRRLLDTGQIDLANQLLGYHYQNTGIIVHGKQLGRQLGFPTLNLKINSQERILGEGIYATKVRLSGKEYLGMASIGRNETFGANQQLTVEINLLNFSKMVYGQQVVVNWYHYLRGQVKFANAQALIEQLKKDQRQTLNYFQK
ncbi:riboflavin biosynthesis protein RibF [Liquorilactobacillus vini]|uniref:Riboflavin biosynthesis protein n=1 Tax=Liquorilactobacillus vini DSM 20605 TaxID=1133569 RepID=A0A0R2CCX2_9LACO|nr:riboflavin biosynthesis protein RibF [Liquorilactobacillus vini]KRM89646.1 bifunctional riboflavin kinase FMN adenylyltransferase [Liquorilactobacillus vini DSM 20605]